jgi:biopolymer transport protein ExbB/TolQ
MRTVALIAIVLGVGVLALTFIPITQTITNVPEIMVKEVEKEVVKSELETRVEAAQQAAQADIEAKAQAAYDAAMNQARKQIELEVTSAYRKEVEEKEAALEKDLSL